MMALLIVPGAAAQAVEDMPGYYPLDDLAIFGNGGAEVEIDLGAPMLKVVAAAARENEPQFAELASQMQRIRVRVGRAAEGDPDAVSDQLARVADGLEGSGWERMIRVHDDDDLVRLYSMSSGDLIVGLTLLVNGDGDEVVLANIVGAMDPELLGKVLGKLEDLDLEKLGIDVDD